MNWTIFTNYVIIPQIVWLDVILGQLCEIASLHDIRSP